MNSQSLSKKLWDFSHDNPEKIKPNHIAAFFYAIELYSKSGYKDEINFPTSLVMEATGIKSQKHYRNTLNELIDFKLITMVKKSNNQHSANIISITNIPEQIDQVIEVTEIKTEAEVPKKPSKKTENPKVKKPGEKRKKFVKPTIEELEEQFFIKGENDYKNLSIKFHSYYESKGWTIGKSPMKNWRAAVNTWIANQKNFSKTNKDAITEDKIGRTPISQLQNAGSTIDFTKFNN